MPIQKEVMSKQIEALDDIFSKFIRLRDSDEYGMITCISCGKRVKWKDSDAGHFVSRRHMSLRFDCKNVNAQCRECNRVKDGNIVGYTLGLRKKYGLAILNGLLEKKSEEKQWTDEELEFMTRYYNKKVKILQK